MHAGKDNSFVVSTTETFFSNDILVRTIFALQCDFQHQSQVSVAGYDGNVFLEVNGAILERKA